MSGLQSVLSKSCDELIVDPRCQARECMNGETIEEYADLFREGEVPPPLEVFKVDGRLIVVDGFHRHESASRAGVVTLPVRVVGQGSMSDAVWYALSTNHRHALKRTRADKRKAVRMAIDLGMDRSDREIARQVGVTHPFVAKLRRGEQLKIAPVQADPEDLRREADKDFESGNFERARVFYEKAIAALRAQSPYTPLRIKLVEGPRLCKERMAPLKRENRIRAARGEVMCVVCGTQSVVELNLSWTRTGLCPPCIEYALARSRPLVAEAAE